MPVRVRAMCDNYDVNNNYLTCMTYFKLPFETRGTDSNVISACPLTNREPVSK